MTRAMIGLGVSLLVTFAAAAIGAQFMPGAWYAGIAKPSWNPPNWIFGPVWTALYLMMAVAAWMVWKATGATGVRHALMLFLVQLALNAAWSWLFFGRERPDLALMDIAALWLTIVATTWAFWGIERRAGMLMLPYLAWVSFASCLNFAIWRLNRG
jgi:tryptophan-rich sensory protein